MRNLQDTFETSKRSFFICMTVLLSTRFYNKQHFYKQRQAEIGKKSY